MRLLARLGFRRLVSAGREAPVLPGLAEQQLRRIEERDRLLRESHLRLESSLATHERDLVRRKRMLYRSKQRGWLEVDLLLGSFAAVHVQTMSPSQLDEFEEVLREETIDVFNFVTGKQSIPSHLAENSVLRSLQEYAKKNTINSPESYAEAKERANLI